MLCLVVNQILVYHLVILEVYFYLGRVSIFTRACVVRSHDYHTRFLHGTAGASPDYLWALIQMVIQSLFISYIL
jgi:hypothetical protein